MQADNTIFDVLNAAQHIPTFEGLCQVFETMRLGHLVERYEDQLKHHYRLEEAKGDEPVDEPGDEPGDEPVDELDAEPCEGFRFRDNQVAGLERNKACNFASGIHVQVMGAGKSIMIMRTFQDKLEHDLTQQPTNKHVYVLLTDRIEILRKWFFNEDGSLDDTKKRRWRDQSIIDMDRFEVLDTIYDKDVVIIEKVNRARRPTLVIMNNAFLRTNKKYMDLEPNISLVIVDECHCISGPQTFLAMRHMRYHLGASIIGFSATPLRDTKVSKKNLVDVFGHDGKLRILSFYHLLDALRDDVVLPFRFVITEATASREQTGTDLIALERVLRHELEALPYKKGIAWARYINQIDPESKNYKFFTDKFPELDLCYTYHTMQDGKDMIDRFYAKDNNAVILCVGRLREGSDVPHVDFGLYLDKVKKRQQLVSLQTSGRIIRPDPEGRKKYGLIIENIKMDGKPIEFQTVEKILDYLESIAGLSEDMDPDVLRDLHHRTQILPERNEIVISIDDNPRHDTVIKLDIMNIDWSQLKQLLMQAVQERIGDRNKLQELKEMIAEAGKHATFDMDCRFWDVYDAIPNKASKGLPENLYEAYKDVWEKHTWYQMLGYETHWWNKKQIVQHFMKRMVKDISKEMYHQERRKYLVMPPYPEELFRVEGFQDYDTFFV
jgi:superfamily II DNA or RNA helicase